MKAPPKVVFLDRDGVINRKAPAGDYVKCWQEFEFLPSAKEALKLLKGAGYRVIIVTNQRGIARGLMTRHDLQQIHAQMLDELTRLGVHIDAIYSCPHDEGKCRCRKPQAGLFWAAKGDFPDLDFGSSLLIGDALSDMEAGARLGCRNILIAEPSRAPHLLALARTAGIAIAGHAPSLFDAVVRELSGHGPQHLQGHDRRQTEAI